MNNKTKQKLVVLSGAGISAESGLKTFRDSDGLWEGYNVYEVATPEAWKKNPVLVQEFYNERRKAVLNAKPNEAHILLAKLEDFFDVHIITQNIDDLHERGGSTNVLHLHGIITKAQSSINADLLYDIDGWELKMGQTCELGSQLRPHVVWFGESVPNIPVAAQIVSKADLFLVVGTSLQVYPAAGLVNYFSADKPMFAIDPKPLPIQYSEQLTFIQNTAVEGMKILFDKLINEFI
ncbi:MAG: SIR2 family NAD-dependent protein deacylase [Bacteroidia bacterium]